MIAARRTRFNFALQRACELAQAHAKPLLIFEPLNAGYPFACDRFHAFVLDGMRANRDGCAAHGITYYPYVEPQTGDGRGLLRALAERALAVVTDWYPTFILPAVVAAGAARSPVRLESVDTNGIIPVQDHGRAYPTARGYRGFVQKTLRRYLGEFPLEDPFAPLQTQRSKVAAPANVLKRWPAADLERTNVELTAHLPIDHTVGSVRRTGGWPAATDTLAAFLKHRLARYAADSNNPDADVTSQLSPYLHFGHISAHEVFARTMTHEKWTSRKLTKTRAGARDGWWGTSPGAEHFLEQLVVWRELGFNGAAWTPGFESYETLPAWARATLGAHLDDPRPHIYSLEQLEAAETEDRIWNAAQTQLRREGWFHGYMRMVWGKKILEWSRQPTDALDAMEWLMHKYSLDGRDPVSYLNFGWVLGRYDRPWFERPIFGTVRYMTTDSARRKFKLREYLARYGGSREENDKPGKQLDFF